MRAAEAQGYISGWCGTGTGHGRCAGSYAGTRCSCGCHTDLQQTLPGMVADSTEPSGPVPAAA